MSEDKSKPTNHEPSRRAILGGGVKAVAVTAGASAGGFLVGRGEHGLIPEAQAQSKSAAQAAQARAHVGPGQLDEYYVFFSGGQSGEMRIIGLPSMRELMRVPVFNFDGATVNGW